MNRALLGVLSFAVFPAIAVMVGGGVALIRSPGPAMRSAIQHFAAGVIFCVLATELLPDLLHRRMPLVTVIGFSLGVGAMLGLKYFAARKNHKDATSANRPSTLIVVMGIDIALDGMLIGLGFAAGQKQGLLLTIALVLEVLFLGVSCATSLVSSVSRLKIIRTTAVLAGLLLVGASAGALALTTLPAAVLDGLLAFGVAALLYLVTEELLVEAHEAPETPFQTAMFFVGFIVLFTIDMLL